MRRTTVHKIIYMAGGYPGAHVTHGLLPRAALFGWIRRVSVKLDYGFYDFSRDAG